MNHTKTHSNIRNVNVIATTKLQSNSGREYDYALQLNVNPETGRTRVTDEIYCPVSVRPYQLLHLMVKVIKAVNPALIEGEEVAQVVRNPCRQPGRKHLALEYGDKRYRLNHEVEGKWVSNPALIPMVRTVARMKELDDIAYSLANWGELQYRDINPENPYHWEVWIQP
jgi:hypothetical protein